MEADVLQRAYHFLNDRVWGGKLPRGIRIKECRESDLSGTIMTVAAGNTSSPLIRVNVDRLRSKTNEYIISSLGHEMGHIYKWRPGDGHDSIWIAGMEEKGFEIDIWYDSDNERQATETVIPGGLFDRAMKEFLGVADEETSVAPYVSGGRSLSTGTNQLHAAQDLMRITRTHADIMGHIGRLGDRLSDVEDGLHRVSSAVDYLKAQQDIIAGINEAAVEHFDAQQRLYENASAGRQAERSFHRRALGMMNDKIQEETGRYFAERTAESVQRHQRAVPKANSEEAVGGLARTIDDWNMRTPRAASVPSSRKLVFAGPQPWD